MKVEKNICPNCEKKTDIELVSATEEIKVRNELIKVKVEFFKCLSCLENFDNPDSDDDPIEEAYIKYRRLHGMIQPDEIRDFRKRYGLSQHEMSKLLGFGGATLSRYENGALQDETHEKILRLAMEPHNLLKLIEESQKAFNDNTKKERLIKELKMEEEESFSFEKLYEEFFGGYKGSELSGYRELDITKLFNAIIFLCKGGEVPKTKLNKLLFFCDFKHFKEYAVSVTGLQYAHIPYGPSPDNFNHYFATLVDERAIEVKEVTFKGFVGEFFISLKEPDLSLFSDTELKILINVKDYFKSFSAGKITDFSHNEKGFKETSIGNLISYKYAKELQI